MSIELADHARDIAVRASRAVGLEISGVDMIFRGDEPVVLEVNASPGFRGLLQATQINAADAMVDIRCWSGRKSGVTMRRPRLAAAAAVASTAAGRQVTRK